MFAAHRKRSDAPVIFWGWLMHPLIVLKLPIANQRETRFTAFEFGRRYTSRDYVQVLIVRGRMKRRAVAEAVMRIDILDPKYPTH